MYKIVYVLGAGFSAPLGLPVMNNFIEKSQEIYSNGDQKYNYFKNIFKMRDEISCLKNIMSCNLHNIEEILSILEMGYYVSDNKRTLKQYKNYLKDVVDFYTPRFEPKNIHENDPQILDKVFRSYMAPISIYYFSFISHLFNITYALQNMQKTSIDLGNKPREYSIITLNYDMVIENIIDRINQYCITLNDAPKLELIYEYKTDLTYKNNVLKLVKLHGTSDNADNIIAPTWNKSISTNSSKIKRIWRLAYTLLSEANEIRILGYSLPITDNYLKYLLSISLKSNELNNTPLKKIDVITLNNQSDTKERYDKLFKDYPNYRFYDMDITKYLELLHTPPYIVRFYSSDGLEQTHNNFMKSYNK